MGCNVKSETSENNNSGGLKKVVVVFFALFGMFSFVLLVLALIYVFLYPQSIRSSAPIIPIADGFELYDDMKEAEEREELGETQEAPDYKKRKRN